MKRLLLPVWRRLRGTPGSPVRAASAVALGVLIGCQPLYGAHLLLVLGVCLPLRLDAVLAYLAANISNPVLAPLLIFAEVQAGSYVLTGRFVELDLEQARRLGASGFARQLLVGSAVVGAALALLGFGVAWLVARGRAGRELPPAGGPGDAVQAALDRTRARYRRAPRADRYFVACKLALDPIFGLSAELGGGFGRVLDLGCGRGQLGLFLHELGRASRLTGVDSDARKIEVARAAGPEASFRVADAAQLELPEADTILLVDVLHYLPSSEQDALLAAATRAVAPGGRVLVRDLDAEPSARGAVTRFFEWCGRRVGLNRGRATHYRPARDVVRLLESAGLTCRVQGASARTPFANVLIVAGGSPAANVDSSGSAPSTLVSAAKA